MLMQQEFRAERVNCWTPEQDSTLAEIILNQIEAGGTQLKAFEIAAQKLNRTPGACGFRWNGVLRQSYAKEIAQAKKNRKGTYRKPRHEVTVTTSSSSAMQDVMEFLSRTDRSYIELQFRAEELRSEIMALKLRLQTLETSRFQLPLTRQQVSAETTALKSFFERLSDVENDDIQK